VITQATFRLHPLPHGKRTLTILPRRIGEAQALLLALQDANLSHAALQLRCGASMAPELDILLEGTEAGMEAQAARIRSIARPAAVKEGSEAVWKTREEIAGQDAVSKFSVLPSQIADAIAAIGRAGDGSWRGVAQATGIGWASVKAPLEDVRAQLEGEGGTLTVLRQPAGGTPIEAWGDAGDTLPLMREIKRRFDPHNTLNPGRFVGGI
jgi:glycolate oxidase FAD binding subunit